MEPEKKDEAPEAVEEQTPTPEVEEAPQVEEQDAPVDALSRSPEDLQEEAEQHAAENADPHAEPEKKIPPIKQIFRKINVYFLGFVMLVIVAGAVTIVNYINSTKPPVVPSIASQELTEDALKQLANNDASVGNTSQTLTIQGNAIISGQTLMRGDLNVAGDLQTGGDIRGPALTISGDSNLGNTQINTLQVAQNTAVQGDTTLNTLSVSGEASLSGPVTASQITVTRLILSGNAVLEVPNHVMFTGGTPTRSPNQGVIGNGGTVSMSGSDTAGTISINTGNNPTSGCMLRITFQQAFSRQPRVLVSPVGSSAGSLQFYTERDSNGFSLCSVNAPAANRSFAFDYFVTGN